MKDSKPKVANKMPVARFWYKGHHTHPVEKAGLVIAERTDKTMITMYVLRDGKQTYALGDAPIRSFRRDRISRFYSLRREVRERLGVTRRMQDKSTLVRADINELVHNGV